jgi:excisionase family DNA binding protein
MEPVHFNIGITIERESMPILIELMKTVLRSARSDDDNKTARQRASEHALFAGQKPPTDKGLLVNSREAAKLLKISERTLWQMWNDGMMPKPIRIGQAVRFSVEELNAWVNAGGPLQKDWKWPQ